jgi:hypothetical protein
MKKKDQLFFVRESDQSSDKNEGGVFELVLGAEQVREVAEGRACKFRVLNSGPVKAALFSDQINPLTQLSIVPCYVSVPTLHLFWNHSEALTPQLEFKAFHNHISILFFSFLTSSSAPSA